MNQFQTLRGNLTRLKRYYATFYKLNYNKENKEHLGYPFENNYSIVGSVIHADYFMFQQIMGFKTASTDNFRLNETQLNWAYYFICNCWKNKKQHTLAIFLLHITKQILHKNPNTFDTYTINHMCKNILANEAYFIAKLENDSSYDDSWEPNA